MRIGFIISFLLTAPILLYSPWSKEILGLSLPLPLPVSSAFPDGGINLFLLLLTSLIIFWPGKIFILDAYLALKKRNLNVSMLTVLVVLVGYVYSFAATILSNLGHETFFGAVALLITLSLLVEWIKNSILGSAMSSDDAAKVIEMVKKSRLTGYLMALTVTISLAVFYGWYFYGGVSFFTALAFTFSVVIVVTPSAFSMARLATAAVGSSVGAKRNFLVMKSSSLEKTAKIDSVVMDKNGLLTDGILKITDILAYNGFSQEDVLKYESNVGVKSNHPLAKAILEEIKQKNVVTLKPMDKFESFAGLGIKAQVNGKTILSGKEKFLIGNNVDISAGNEIIRQMAREGKILNLLAIDGIFAGLIAATDTIKSTARQTIGELKSLGVEPIIMTSEPLQTLEAVGKELGIAEYYSATLPQDKTDYIKKLQKEGRLVCIVGERMNNLSALAQSDASMIIDINDDTDGSQKISDFIFKTSEPLNIVTAIKLSRAAAKKIKQSFFWIMVYNIIAIPVAAGAFYKISGWQLRPEMFIVFMSASSVGIVMNSVILKKYDLQ